MKQPKEIANEMVLRPRFKLDLPHSKEFVLQLFEEAQKTTKEFVVHCIDDHVFIKILKEKQHFWSPQLDLEVIDDDDLSSTLYGLFGPKPSVWTLFMFIHFVVAGLFIGMGIWTYTNITLEKPYALQVTILGLLVIAWFVLYFAGRMGKATGHDEMLQLYTFMKQVLQI